MRGVRRNVQQIIAASNLAVGACDWRSDDIEPLFFFFFQQQGEFRQCLMKYCKIIISLLRAREICIGTE